MGFFLFFVIVVPALMCLVGDDSPPYYSQKELDEMHSEFWRKF